MTRAGREGETAAKLRLAFDAMQETRAVCLFDEFDALGTDRAAKNEVGASSATGATFSSERCRRRSRSRHTPAAGRQYLLVLPPGRSAAVLVGALREPTGLLDSGRLPWECSKSLDVDNLS